MRCILSAVVLLFLAAGARAEWKPAKGPLFTRFAADVSPEKVHPEYPRPQMVRSQWRSLNGLWDLQVTGKDEKRPERYAEQILVPFPIESALSGVGRRVKPGERLWYRRTFDVPAEWKGQRVLLHFGAVDWESVVFLNSKEIASHRGGYDPFTIDLTEHLKPEGQQTLMVAVRDATTDGKQPVGKQALKPEGIWYTPTSGIWQTVWIEAVAQTYIERFRVVPDLEAKGVRIRVTAAGTGKEPAVSVVALAEGKAVAEAGGKVGEELTLAIAEPRPWTPETPFLYDLKLVLTDEKGNKDEVGSYFAIRKISVGPDEKGTTRILLNNKSVFQLGPLDQGFWPDGLYTPPTDEAMRFDIETMKKFGFNMVRKHVKVEPDRWYYHCDRLGLLVWQDMPSLPLREPDAESRQNFAVELERMINALSNHPSIVVWVPFNEGWGQHETERVVEQVRKLDPTRLIDNASGWTDKKVGDLLDVHTYPNPVAPKPEKKRAAVIGEYGGLGFPVAEHRWTREGWSYSDFKTEEDLTRAYEALCDALYEQTRSPGISAAVYTQLTDVETEINGLMTYDRKVFKIDPETAAAAHAGRTPPRRIGESALFVGEGRLELTCARAGAEIHYTLDGRAPTRTAPLYEAPIRLTETTTVRARAFWPDGASRVISHEMKKATPRKPVTPAEKTYPGLLLSRYDLARPVQKLPDFAGLKPAHAAVSDGVNLARAGMGNHFALKYEGWLSVPETGVYTFHLSSDDGSRLLIGGEVVVDNDGVHGVRERVGSVPLEAGQHAIAVHYFQYDRGLALKLEYTGPKIARRQVPAAAFTHARTAPLVCLPPVLDNPTTLFIDSTVAVLSCPYRDARITYTLDGSEPSKESAAYTGPVKIEDSVTVKAKAFADEMQPSAVQTFAFKKTTPHKATPVEKTRPGLKATYYELPGVPAKMPEFATLTPRKTMILAQLDVTRVERTEHYALLFEGLLTVPRTGVYTFHLQADDEGRLEIAGETVIEKSHWTDAVKGQPPRVGSIALEAGTHPFVLRYYQGIGGRGLELEYEGPRVRRGPIPEASFTHLSPP
jgi:hypothetical protein